MSWDIVYPNKTRGPKKSSFIKKNAVSIPEKEPNDNPAKTSVITSETSNVHTTRDAYTILSLPENTFLLIIFFVDNKKRQSTISEIASNVSEYGLKDVVLGTMKKTQYSTAELFKSPMRIM